MNGNGRFEIIDAFSLSAEQRALLRPGEGVEDERGNVHHLPRFFFAVPSWAEAKQAKLAEHFKLAELMMVDCREAAPLFPPRSRGDGPQARHRVHEP